MNTLPIARTAYFQWLMNTTYEGVAVEAIQNGFDGSWERLIAKSLFSDAMNGNQLAFRVLELTGDKEYTSETYLKAAYLIASSKIPSEDLVDIGIE